MFLHIGRGKLIPKSSIIGVFDLEITSQSKRTKAFLSKKEKENRVINVCDDIPRSFVVTREGENERVYISQISPQTLKARSGELIETE
ncbi:MAG: DUF370 domain-containing protein [Oscillospiraceae bacterium]|nr:DUF370 domain-containing protein [Oscillospiraceae bacterium]